MERGLKKLILKLERRRVEFARPARVSGTSNLSVSGGLWTFGLNQPEFGLKPQPEFGLNWVVNSDLLKFR